MGVKSLVSDNTYGDCMWTVQDDSVTHQCTTKGKFNSWPTSESPNALKINFDS